MRCPDVQARMLEGRPEPADRLHVSACAACRAALPELERLRTRLADPALWEEPPPDLEKRIVDSATAGSSPGPGRRLRWAAVAATVTLVVVGSWWIQTRPDWTVVLAPTDQAPQARAVVYGWNRPEGTRMVVEVEGLPDAGDDGYYEVWLTAPDGRHLSAGTFRAAGEVVVWGAFPRSEFPRIWITYEPVDDDPGPSGITVLDTAA